MLAEKISNSTITDDEWCDAIIHSVDHPKYIFNGVQLPDFPDEHLQNLTIKDGASPNMLKGACKLYGHVKDACKKLDQPIHSDTKILDFGCGWGRIARFFLKEVKRKNIYGVEVLPELVEACKSTFDNDNFHLITQTGSLPFEDNTFDVLFANSVFSHLDLDRSQHWIAEIHRVLKPGGIAALTIIDTDKFVQMSKSGNDWFASLGIDSDETLDKLNSGELVWVSTNRTGNLDGYGLTFMPLSWVENNWSNNFHLREANPAYSQCVLALQKR